VSLELFKALELGYKIVNLHEVWHFENIVKYDKATKSGGLFSAYIKKFLKIKQQVDRFPSACKTFEEKMEYVNNYEKVEGIRLDFDKIVKNPGLRQLAKLMLNSFWGKFGQRNNLTKIEYFVDPEKFAKLVFFDNTKEIKSLQFFGEKMVAAQFAVEAYVTAQANLKWYSYLGK